MRPLGQASFSLIIRGHLGTAIQGRPGKDTRRTQLVIIKERALQETSFAHFLSPTSSFKM